MAIKKSQKTVLTHDLVLSKILQFFNKAKTPEEIINGISDDPTFGKSKATYGIRPSVAKRILDTRAKLPGNKFAEIQQIDKIPGIGPDTLNDIFYSFYSDEMKTKLSKEYDVSLDFEYENNLLSITIENIGDSILNKVSVEFDKKILGLNKQKKISDMRIFKSISVFPPNKKFKIFVDSFSSYINNKQPMSISSSITYYKNAKKNNYVLKHDLNIYRDYVELLANDEKISC